MRTIITHNGKFHADEVFAVALLQYVFKNTEIIRVPHQKDISKYVNDHTFIICDIGRVYDPSNLQFDHHQYTKDEELRSSAGMVLDYLIESNEYLNCLRDIVTQIDKNDVGIRAALPGEFSWVISQYNDEDVYSESQNIAFKNAVACASTVINSLVRKELQIISASKVIMEAEVCETLEDKKFNVIYLPKYTPGYIDAIKTNHLLNVDCVMWYDETKDTFSAKIVNEDDNYKPLNRKIYCQEPLPKDIEFVHKGEFFMVAKTKEALITYLETNLRV